MDFLPKNIETAVKIDKNLAISAQKLISELNFDVKKAIFVSDSNIFNNCCEFFDNDFLNSIDNHLILENPSANEENLEIIESNLANCKFIIGLGSGTINDLCKFTSFKQNIPYAIFASAPSMNGYLSQNASISINGHKKTLAATLPKAIFCDLDILKNAPSSMIKAGIGDSMCFYSCWFDWLLSHLLLETEFVSESFTILVEKMGLLTQNYREFSLKDDDLLKLLIEILLLSGASMTLAKSSNPASQSEHLIAHSFSMRYPEKSNKILHGLQIASTSLISAKIQEEFLAQDYIEMREPTFLERELNDFFGSEIAAECKKEYAQKANLIRQNRKFLAQELTQNWPRYCKILSKVFMSENQLSDIFHYFNIETGAKALNLEYEEYNQVISYAKFIRNRFTCLDL